jgi:hypothetical protein
MTNVSNAVCTFKCMSCETMIVARIPTIRLYNFPEASGCVMGHEKPIKCPKCQTGYVPIIKSISGDAKITFGWRAITAEEQKEVIPENSLNVSVLSKGNGRLITQEETKKHEDSDSEEDELPRESRKTIQ